ncbi:MAG: TolC family protein, partial [Planctomycetota bacterium]
ARTFSILCLVQFALPLLISQGQQSRVSSRGNHKQPTLPTKMHRFDSNKKAFAAAEGVGSSLPTLVHELPPPPSVRPKSEQARPTSLNRIRFQQDDNLQSLPPPPSLKPQASVDEKYQRNAPQPAAPLPWQEDPFLPKPEVEAVRAIPDGIHSIPPPVRDEITSDTTDNEFESNATTAASSMVRLQSASAMKMPLHTIRVKPANKDSDGRQLLQPFRRRFAQVAHAPGKPMIQPSEPLPTSLHFWWYPAVTSSVLIGNREPNYCRLPQLLSKAAIKSPQLQIARLESQVQRNAVLVQASQFDWMQFINSSYDRLNDPIGSTLTTGNNDDRFQQSNWIGAAGLSKKNLYGGQLEIAQQLGYLNNNSIFLLPPNQGTTRLQLNYRQPMLRQGGRDYNEALILLAKTDYRSSIDELIDISNQHFADVTSTYWNLFRLRAEYSQKLRLIESAKEILQHLNARSQMDATPREILRTRAALKTRSAEIARLATNIQDTETQLRLLVADPCSGTSSAKEIVPNEFPTLDYHHVQLEDAVSTALCNRRDISRAIRKIRAANRRAGVAKNELFPKLDLIVGSYVAGLEGDSDVFDAWVNQFSDGGPGINFGFEFELPRGNRAAKAQQQIRLVELKQELRRFRLVAQRAIAEVEIAVRDLHTSYAELSSRYQAMQATEQETRYLLDRWQSLPGREDSYLLLLEDLLSSQERLAGEEAAFAAAQSRYAMSFTQLHQSMGTLLQVDDVE